MNPEETESYLSSIEEYIFDEKKIVTYGWLSKTLGLHSNLSKQLLYTFFENNPKKGELSATYVLIGQSKDGDSRQVLIVKDKNLQDVESSLKIVTSKHIYSVQKCMEILDLDVLYTAEKGDNINTISHGLSAINFNCNERDSTLIEKLRLNALPIINQSGKKTYPSLSKNKSPVKKLRDDQSVKNTISPEKKESTAKMDTEKTVIPSMFKNSVAPKKKALEKAPVNKKTSKGIGAFFSKTSKPVTEPKTIEDKKHIVEEEFNFNIDKESGPKMENESDSKVVEMKSPLKENKANLNNCIENKSNVSKTTDSKKAIQKIVKEDSKSSKESKKSISKRTGHKKNTTKKVNKDEKKRKRLVVLSDSESSNVSEDEDEIQREPTPEPEPTAVPVDDDDEDIVLGTPEPSRKRKKKLVSKTYMTSDGYMVTDKQMVDASGSEDEVAGPEKKFKQTTTNDDESSSKNSNSTTESKLSKPSSPKKKVSPKKKIISPQKTKQSSLMNFFKKK